MEGDRCDCDWGCNCNSRGLVNEKSLGFGSVICCDFNDCTDAPNFWTSMGEVRTELIELGDEIGNLMEFTLEPDVNDNDVEIDECLDGIDAEFKEIDFF